MHIRLTPASFLLVALCFFLSADPAGSIDISDTPVDTKVTSAPPIIMFVLDDSGSMDWEFIVDGQSDGLFDGGYAYLFGNPGDNAYTWGYVPLSSTQRKKWKATWYGYNKMYYNPKNDYYPWPTLSNADTTNPRSNPINASPTWDITGTYFEIGSGGGAMIDQIIDETDPGFSLINGSWYYEDNHGEGYGDDFYDTSVDGNFNHGLNRHTARWTPTGLNAGSYKVYAWWRTIDNYSRSVTYTIQHSGTSHDVDVDQEENASRWNLLGTFAFTGGGSEYVELDHTPGNNGTHACADAVRFEEVGSMVTVRYAHYYILDDTDGDGIKDDGETLYLVNFNNGIRQYYTVSETSGTVTSLTPITESDMPDTYRAKIYDDSGNFIRFQSDAEELQNWANWYSFYRRRELAAKAAVANVIYAMDGVKVGFYSINGDLRQAVLPIRLDTEVLQTTILDESDAGFTKTGNWRWISGNSEAYNNDFWDTTNDAGVPYTAKWTPPSLTAGQYEVFAYWRSYGDYSRAVPYEIKHAGGTTTVTVNQEQFEDRWNSLGIFNFNGDGTEYVQIAHTPPSDSAHACADAVKFEQISGGAIQNVDDTNTLLTGLYGMDSSGGTPLRLSLKAVGQYLDKDDGLTGGLGDSPIETEANGGACQQAFAILMTDGFWNGNTPSVGNQDGDEGEPFADGNSDTLADVAMKFYKEDLANDVANQVPTNACDSATYQHMVTYTVSFGQSGSLTPPDEDGDGRIDDPCFLNAETDIPNWPNPTTADANKIDDLWHASVNGRGEFFSASDPQALIDSLYLLMENIAARKASGASVSVNGDELGTGTILYQSMYSTGSWTGDVVAYPVDPVTGAVNREENAVIWKASETLEDQNWDTGRLIATYNGVDDGIEFRYSSLTDAQKTVLGSDLVADSAADQTAEQIVQYARGDSISGFRTRTGKLGDIVHSSPVLHGNTVFVGANDGMLHAFNAETGEERFGYVPNLVIGNLGYLKDPAYSHKFFVDLTPTVAENVMVSGSAVTMLVGGLGKGGKGYYALDVTAADSTDISDLETAVSAMVLWEYPKTGVTDDDLGYSFSKAYAVKSNDANYPHIVVFGNGYNSSSEKAVLYVLDTSGSLIKKIDTGISGSNGLSTPALIDVNNDYKLDYIFAGDLAGNMWKFDLTGSSSANWDVAYKSGTTPKPLISISGQPITSQPDVMRHPEKPGYLVVFGTGQYLAEADRTNMTIQAIYGIWDYGDDGDDSEYLGAFDSSATPSLSNQAANVTLLEQTEIDWRTISGHGLRTLSNNAPNWATVADSDTGQRANPGDLNAGVTVHAGWFFNLVHSSEADPAEEGERVVKDVIIRDGNAIVISIVPNTSPCSGGGNSIVHEIDAATGGRLSEAQFDIDSDGVIDENDLITPNGPDGSPLLDDDGNPVRVPPTGKGFTGILFPPVFLTMPDKTREMKLFSTSAGSTEAVFEKVERKAMYYWIMR